MTRSLTCGWCGKRVPTTNGAAKSHVADGKTCPGSGRPIAQHKFLRRSHAEARGTKNLPHGK